MSSFSLSWISVILESSNSDRVFLFFRNVFGNLRGPGFGHPGDSLHIVFWVLDSNFPCQYLKSSLVPAPVLGLRWGEAFLCFLPLLLLPRDEVRNHSVVFILTFPDPIFTLSFLNDVADLEVVLSDLLIPLSPLFLTFTDLVFLPGFPGVFLDLSVVCLGNFLPTENVFLESSFFSPFSTPDPSSFPQWCP